VAYKLIHSQILPFELTNGNDGRKPEAKMQSGTRTTHGYSRSPTYVSWMKMKSRCLNPNAGNYERYGGAGITVCAEWLSFEAFQQDMGDRPSLRHSLDRKDSTQGYSKANCRWATDEEQARNRSCCIRLVIGNQSMSPIEWAARMGISVKTIYSRLEMGWSDADAIHGRPSRARLIEAYGKAQTLSEWARDTGLSAATINKRLKRGWGSEAALTKAV